MKYRYDQTLRRRWPLIIIPVVLLVGGVLALLWWMPHDPVPSNVKKAVAFPVYYPLQSKLPDGYTLDTSSFRASDQAVVYTISYGQNQKIVTTVQKRPDDNELANFYKNTIPIHRDVLTLVGKAAVGAIGDQTFVSLPTDDTSWLILTGPSTIDRDQLDAVLKSIVKAR
jgi:hypothetical protein